VDRDSSVGIVIRYDLDGPGVESRWGARFFTPVKTGPGGPPPSQPPIKWVPGLSGGGGGKRQR